MGFAPLRLVSRLRAQALRDGDEQNQVAKDALQGAKVLLGDISSQPKGYTQKMLRIQGSLNPHFANDGVSSRKSRLEPWSLSPMCKQHHWLQRIDASQLCESPVRSIGNPQPERLPTGFSATRHGPVKDFKSVSIRQHISASNFRIQPTLSADCVQKTIHIVC